MRATAVAVTLTLAGSGLFVPASPQAEGPAAPSPHTITITGRVDTIRSLGDSLVIELGGPWRRRFAAVIDRTDVVVSLPEVHELLHGRVVRLSGPVTENRGRYEIRLRDLRAVEVLADDAVPGDEPSLPDVVSRVDPVELAKAVQRLERRVADLQRAQDEQRQALTALEKSLRTSPRVTPPSRPGYGALERRVRRIETALDTLVHNAR